MISSLDHEKINVRCDATRALGELGNPKAVDYVINRLKDEWVNVRIYAVTSLGKLGDTKAVPALIEVLQNTQENELVRAVQQQHLAYFVIRELYYRSENSL